MTPCPDERTIRSHLAGGSSESADAALRAHMAECQACRERAERLGQPDTGAPTADLPIMSGDLAARLERSGKQPDQIGPFHILGKLGEGGMGTVWLAEQREPIQRQVALKVIKPGSDTREFMARFEAERQALAKMEHDNVARVFQAASTDDGLPYFAMEYVKGEPITHYCDRQRLTPHERLELFIRVCQAVQHAHQKGLIHRDIKPSNVLVAETDEGPVPKVIDFGIAKAIDQAASDQTLDTQVGQVVGTPAYMSPEQADSSQDIDTRADVYALGILLYELLVGELPFDSKVMRRGPLSEIQRIIREERPIRPSTRLGRLGQRSTTIAEHRKTDSRLLERQLRGDLDWITLKAIEKDRGRRYATALELAQDVERYLKFEPVLAGPPSGLYVLKKFVRRNKWPVFSSVVLSLLLTLTAILTARVSKNAAQAAESKFETAQSLAEQGKWDEAIETCQACLAAGFKDELRVKLLIVESWIATGEIASARNELESLLQRVDLGARRGSVLLGYGDLLMMETDEQVTAREIIREAIDEGLEPAQDAYALGLIAETATAALEHFQDAVEMDQSNYRYNQLKAIALFILGQLDEAEECLIRSSRVIEDTYTTVGLATVAAFRSEDRRIDELLNRGKSTSNIERLERARAILKSISSLLPLDEWFANSDDATVQSVKIMMIKLQIANIRVAAAASGRYRGPFLGLLVHKPPWVARGLDVYESAIFEAFTGGTEEALARLSETSEGHPLAISHSLQGAILRYLGRREEAVKAFTRALEVPTLIGVHRRALLDLTITQWELSEQGQNVKLVSVPAELIRRYADKYPDLGARDARVVAEIARTTGQFDLARWALFQWLSHDDTNARAWRALAWIECDDENWFACEQAALTAQQYDTKGEYTKDITDSLTLARQKIRESATLPQYSQPAPSINDN